ncbi:hypothetical protein B0H16DRAFT_1742157 [Mycena metata]|uniref:Uncharacterized protein n=1 Tax=Mycena metata TaxID=1033252 RepID=A0AAD7H9D0_9AGAR|nr:hypothetical protein B0H16DRAFT_1742157 [Mycena metata]
MNLRAKIRSDFPKVWANLALFPKEVFPDAEASEEWNGGRTKHRPRARAHAPPPSLIPSTKTTTHTSFYRIAVTPSSYHCQNAHPTRSPRTRTIVPIPDADVVHAHARSNVPMLPMLAPRCYWSGNTLRARGTMSGSEVWCFGACWVGATCTSFGGAPGALRAANCAGDARCTTGARGLEFQHGASAGYLNLCSRSFTSQRTQRSQYHKHDIPLTAFTSPRTKTIIWSTEQEEECRTMGEDDV